MYHFTVSVFFKLKYISPSHYIIKPIDLRGKAKAGFLALQKKLESLRPYFSPVKNDRIEHSFLSSISTTKNLRLFGSRFHFFPPEM